MPGGPGWTALLVLPWLFVGAATAIGARRVGRRLDEGPRRRLWGLSAALAFPAGYAALRWVGPPDPSALDLLFPTGLAMAAVGLSWWLVEALAWRDAWQQAIPSVQLVAAAAGAYATATWVIYRIFAEPEGLGRLIVVFGSTHTFVGMATPALAGLVPAALVWPDEGQGPGGLRRAGSWLLVAYLVLWSMQGIVGLVRILASS